MKIKQIGIFSLIFIALMADALFRPSLIDDKQYNVDTFKRLFELMDVYTINVNTDTTNNQTEVIIYMLINVCFLK